MTASRRPSGLFYLILGGNAPKYEAGFLAKCWVPMLRNTHKGQMLLRLDELLLEPRAPAEGYDIVLALHKKRKF